jgi:uncharacterized membrane protein
MMGGGWFVGLMVLLFGALVVALVVLLIMWAVRASSGHGAHGGVIAPAGGTGHHEAVAIAKKRLANGEITKEQYDEIMNALNGTS